MGHLKFIILGLVKEIDVNMDQSTFIRISLLMFLSGRILSMIIQAPRYELSPEQRKIN